MIYLAFSVYLLGILFVGRGIYRLWADLLRPAAVNWALLPGTIVSEMAYIFGCLITGGEVRRARLIDTGGAARGAGAEPSEPATEAAPKLRYVGPLVAAFAAVVACGAGIVLVHALLGKPVISTFAYGLDARLGLLALPQRLPASTDAFWDQAHTHVDLLRRMGRTWIELDWLNWRVPLFVYLATCLSVRLAPVRRSLRATLGAVVALAGLIAAVGAVWDRFDRLMEDLWPLVTYLWASLVLLLAVTLIVRGAVSLARALLARPGAA